MRREILLTLKEGKLYCQFFSKEQACDSLKLHFI
jgi:hypothetical protein